MARLPLYLTAANDQSGHVVLRLATCRNCGKVKLTSNPCGFDHLAALLEWGSRRLAAESGVYKERDEG